MLDEFGEGKPTGRVHVEMVAVLNVLLIHIVRLHSIRRESGSVVSKYQQQSIICKDGRDSTYRLDSNVTNSCWNCVE
jgi:hypothetical protein